MSKILGMMLTVADIEKMTTFFTEVLSFEKIGTSQLEGKAYESLYGIPRVKAQFSIMIGKDSDGHRLLFVEKED